MGRFDSMMSRGINTYDATAEASDIAQGKSAYARGQKIIGTGQAGGTYQQKTVTPTGSTIAVRPDSGYDALSLVTVNGDANLASQNIRDGVEIYGVTGNYAGGVVAGTTVTVQAVNSISNGERVKLVENTNANMTLISSAYDTSDFAIVSDDFSVGLSNETIDVGATAIHIGIVDEDTRSYEIISASISSSVVTEAIDPSVGTTINEDGTLIAIGAVNNGTNYNGIIMIRINKTSKTATATYFQDPFAGMSLGEYNGYTDIEVNITGTSRSTGTSGYATSYLHTFVLTKNYLICTQKVAYDSGTKTLYDFFNIFYCGANSFSKVAGYRDTYSARADSSSVTTLSYERFVDKYSIGWYNDERLVVIHSANATNTNPETVIEVYTFSGNTSATRAYVSETSTGSPKGRARLYRISSNGEYVIYSDWYDSSSVGRNVVIRAFDAIDLTFTSVYSTTLSGASSTTESLHIDDEGEYYYYKGYIYSSGVQKFYVGTSANPTTSHFNITNGKYFGVLPYKYQINTSEAQYLAYQTGLTTETGVAYGISNSTLLSTEIGTAQKLFET